MKRHTVLILGMVVIFMILLVPIATNTVQAFSKHGPYPIPGELIPFPGHPHGHNHIRVSAPVTPTSSK